MAVRPVESIAQTISFEQFWRWLNAHHNCLLRAGTLDVLLFDHDDYHWHFFVEEDGAHIVQLVRGKELVAELVMMTADIAYVQIEANEHEEHVFDCVLENPEGRDVAYHFVLAHGFDGESDQGSAASRRWTH